MREVEHRIASKTVQRSLHFISRKTKRSPGFDHSEEHWSCILEIPGEYQFYRIRVDGGVAEEEIENQLENYPGSSKKQMMTNLQKWPVGRDSKRLEKLYL